MMSSDGNSIMMRVYASGLELLMDFSGLWLLMYKNGSVKVARK
jgi:hypothetical protein